MEILFDLIKNNWYLFYMLYFFIIDLEFQEYVIPTKIEILETFNPGAVVRILALLWGREDSNGAICGQR